MKKMPLLNFLSPYKTMIEIAVFVAALAFVTVEIHKFMDHQQDIGYQRAVAEYQAKKIAADEANAKVEAALKKQLENAQNAAATRETAIQTIAATNVALSNSLRDTLSAIRAGVPTATVDALRKTTIALGDVLTECQDRRRSVAEEAERLNSEKRTLMDAWPR